jgi:L-threonylcarbamoyladenylate synthase
MEIIKVNINKPSKFVITKTARILKSGGLVVYPTDTAYGLGVNAYNRKAINKLYLLKGRDITKPTHVIVRDWKMVREVTYPNKHAAILYKKLLPGPLTLILPKKKSVPNELTANLPTLGIRIPKNIITLSISKLLSFPYTTPSANRTGGKTPYSITEVNNEIDSKQIDLLLDAGKIPRKLPSTLVDLSKNIPKILREGPISESEIFNALNI